MNQSGSGTFVCAGDTALNPSAPSLPYGTVTEVGPISCASRPDGMQCANSDTGHGFFISIQSYRLF